MNIHKTMLITAAITALLFAAAGSAVAQTQSEMTQEAFVAYKKTDKELNSIYKQILKEYTADNNFTKNLKVSQSIWIKFRDAEVKMKFPGGELSGSAYPMCKAMYLQELTHARIKTLKMWIDGIDEGDVCNGSIKIKE